MATVIPTTHPSLRVVPADEAPFADVEAVFGTRGDPAHCWCQWYKLPGSEWRERAGGDEALRGRLEAQLAADGPGPGLLAYDGDTPVGWCAVEPRPALPRLRTSPIVRDHTPDADLDDATVWAVSCFVVPRQHRRRGVGAALAEASVAYARDHGARVIEAYAIDPSAKVAKTPAAELFHGTVSMFAGAGFVEAARPSASRAIMRVEL
jgi:GNAT superfamily N-acetyltransferase